MKRVLVLSLAVVVGLTAASYGQSKIWVDGRDNTNTGAGGTGGQGIFPAAAATPYTNGQNPAAGGGNSADRFGTAAVNAGRRGAGGVLRLEPDHADSHESTTNPNGAGSAWPNYPIPPATVGDNNSATGHLWIYMDVDDDAVGTGDVISSIGIDTNLSNGPGGAGGFTAQRNTIASVSMAVPNDSTVAAQAGGSPTTPWNGVVTGSSNLGSPPSILGTKMVRVPVTTGPVYNASLGIQPSTVGPYRIARLDVTAGTRNCTARQANNHVDNSTYSVKLSINNLLCTRVFQSSSNPADVEDVQIGYNPYDLTASGALDAAINGSTSGATSANPDAAIQVRMHGDFNGDGNVTSIDVVGFNSAVSASSAGTAKVSQVYLGDFNNNRTVTSIDVTGFNKSVTASSTCP